jgi:hypothetical protein
VWTRRQHTSDGGGIGKCRKSKHLLNCRRFDFNSTRHRSMCTYWRLTCCQPKAARLGRRRGEAGQNFWCADSVVRIPRAPSPSDSRLPTPDLRSRRHVYRPCSCCSDILTTRPDVAIAQYAHSAWRLHDGAFDGVPNAGAQTTGGHLWIGTDAGIVRFDGVRFVRWVSPVETTTVSVSGTRVRARVRANPHISSEDWNDPRAQSRGQEQCKAEVGLSHVGWSPTNVANDCRGESRPGSHGDVLRSTLGASSLVPRARSNPTGFQPVSL